jgi:hypothetical protein
MSVTTFLIGLSVSIISFGWNYWDNQPRRSSVFIAAVLWSIAVALFAVFTRLTLRMERRAAEHRTKLPVSKDDLPGTPRGKDPASWAVTAISAGFVGLMWWTHGFGCAAAFVFVLVAVVVLARVSTAD